MSAYEILDLMQGASLIIMLVAFSVALYRERQTSIVVAAIVVSASYFIHILADLAFSFLFDSQYYNGLVYEIGSRAWYLFFALTDFLVVYFIYKGIAKVRLKPSFFCYLVIYAYFTLALVQVSRYCDRFIFESEYLVTLYEFSVPIINCFVVGFIVLGLFAVPSSKKEIN